MIPTRRDLPFRRKSGLHCPGRARYSFPTARRFVSFGMNARHSFHFVAPRSKSSRQCAAFTLIYWEADKGATQRHSEGTELGLLIVLSFVGCGDPAEQDYKRSSETSAEAVGHLTKASPTAKQRNTLPLSNPSKTANTKNHRRHPAPQNFNNLSGELSEQAEDGDPNAKAALSMLREISRN